MLTIALDFDDTYTADPGLWNHFIEFAVARGHKVICVTMRYPEEPIDMPSSVEIVYTSRMAKRPFMETRGLGMPNIWIDDHPEWVFVDTL